MLRHKKAMNSILPKCPLTYCRFYFVVDCDCNPFRENLFETIA